MMFGEVQDRWVEAVAREVGTRAQVRSTPAWIGVLLLIFFCGLVIWIVYVEHRVDQVEAQIRTPAP